MAGPVSGPRVRLGLTGGIGSGKSTVARLLAGLGATVIDADAISKASTAVGGSAIPAIRATFGDPLVTPEGALDRDQMRALVFADPLARHRLEAIVHPLVRQAIDTQCQAMAGGCAVLDLPLLAESADWQRRVDVVWVVDCSPETQVQRVVQRNGWSAEQVRAVIGAQATREQRLAIAHTVLHNDTTDLHALETQVQAAYAGLRQRFGL